MSVLTIREITESPESSAKQQDIISVTQDGRIF